MSDGTSRRNKNVAGNTKTSRFDCRPVWRGIHRRRTHGGKRDYRAGRNSRTGKEQRRTMEGKAIADREPKAEGEDDERRRRKKKKGVEVALWECQVDFVLSPFLLQRDWRATVCERVCNLPTTKSPQQTHGFNRIK